MSPHTSATASSKTSTSWQKSRTVRRWKSVTWWWIPLEPLYGQLPKWRDFLVEKNTRTPLKSFDVKTAQVPKEQDSNISKGRVATAFRALRHHNYRLWIMGQGLSHIGTWMQSMAQQVLVYRLTGSATALGLVNFMTVLPLVPFALWGGSLADRVPKRTIILITQTLMMV